MAGSLSDSPPGGSVLFVGSKRLGLRLLQLVHRLQPGAVRAVATVDDRGDSRSVFDDLVDFARSASLPLTVVRRRRELAEVVREVAPELCLVSGWYSLIENETLSRVPRGFVGVHPSLLPRYRGAAPLVWALVNGEEVVGPSLFAITEGMDEGGIYAQREVQVGPLDPVGVVLDRVEQAALDMVAAVWPELLAGTAKALPQVHADASYCAPRVPADGEVRWDWPASRVHNFIRAQSEPYPGAFTHHAGTRLTLWSARPVAPHYFGTPGQVARVVDGAAYVVCGDDRAVALERVQPEGQPAVPAADVLKSVRIRLG